jgi:uncharacterized protein (TIGR02145 family)
MRTNFPYMSISTFRTLAFVAFAVITAPLFSQGTCETVEPLGPPTCVDPVIFDGYSYATVEIGTQCWFSENLRSDHYRNDDAIPGDLDNATWGSTTYGGQAYYNNDAGNLSEYGRLYNWYAVDDARGLCPSGWHVPSDDEYTTLTNFLGGTSVAGGKMKETGTEHWGSPNTGATNSSGFTGLGAGWRNSSGNFYGLLSDGTFWSSSPNSSGLTWVRRLESETAAVHGHYDTQVKSGYAVRCARDFTDDCGVLNGDNSSCIADCGETQDHDGYSYATVEIGDQCWFSENLRSDHYRNGDLIPGGLSNSTWSTTTVGAQAYFDNDEGNLSAYGRLYNWYAVDDARALCPFGWHVSSDAEWQTMEMHLGMSESEANSTGWRSSGSVGNKLREEGTEHWTSPNTGATNSSGFTALGSGYRQSGGGFGGLLNLGYFWSSSPSGGYIWIRGLEFFVADVQRGDGTHRDGNAVRCVAD